MTRNLRCTNCTWRPLYYKMFIWAVGSSAPVRFAQLLTVHSLIKRFKISDFPDFFPSNLPYFS